jgi:predicted Rossmann fold flavoprotein
MGLSVQEAIVKIKDHPFVSSGPLLITHWGMSGPAVLKLSSVAARALATLNYRFQVTINWTGGKNEEEVRGEIAEGKSRHPGKQVFNQALSNLPKRLWNYLAFKSGIPEQLQWANLSKEQVNYLVRVLVRDEYPVEGKTTFKEEFVTCGGVALSSVDLKTMESKLVKGLYFAGEVLDIDALTGGFNFQAAWSGGFVAGTSMAAEGSPI